jgi:hypothetical protein
MAQLRMMGRFTDSMLSSRSATNKPNRPKTPPLAPVTYSSKASDDVVGARACVEWRALTDMLLLPLRWHRAGTHHKQA